MTFDPIKTVELLNAEIAAMQELSKKKPDGLTPCEAYHAYTVAVVRDAIMAGIEDANKALEGTGAKAFPVQDLTIHEP